MFKTYFDGRFVLSKGALTSIVFSDRSDGKTFDCKKRALEDYEKDGSITVYMRRYKTEITEKLYNSFFDEVITKEKYLKYNLWQFKGSRRGIQVKKSPRDKEWDWIILFVPLSVAGRLKSQISEVHRIHTIDYDEFIPLDGRYLPGEMTLLMEFWKSIDRDRDTTQLLILGNKITPFNPAFDFFGINIKISKDKVALYRGGTVAVQIYSNKEHREAREKGKFREMIKGTCYEEYDTGGVLNALNISIKSRDGYDFYCRFKTQLGSGTIWYKSGKMVISEYDRKDGICIVDKFYNQDKEEYLCTYGNFRNIFKEIYKRGDMYFETEKAFYYFEKILTKIGSM